MIALVSDTEIAFDDIGSGLPVVFLHAFPLNRTMWDPQVSALVGECRCIPIDFRGFGDSAAVGRTDGPLRRRRRRRARRAADRARGHHRPVARGYVTFAFWRRHRDRVRALVLADTRPGDLIENVARRRELIEMAETQGVPPWRTQIAGLMGKTTRNNARHL
jgi:pimeloyl-ACP methyl ester carboxylesterase